MPFRDFIENYTHGDDFDWDGFKTAALAEYAKDDSAATAKIDTLNERNAALVTEQRDLKNELWDMMKKIPSDKADPVGQKHQDDADADITISSLFGKKE